MELYQEFLLTAFLSVILAALIGTLFSGRDADRDPEPDKLGGEAAAAAAADADAPRSSDPTASQLKHDERTSDDEVKTGTADADRAEQEHEQEHQQEQEICQVRAEQEDPAEEARSSEIDALEKRFQDLQRQVRESSVEKEEGFAGESNVVESVEVEVVVKERSEGEKSADEGVDERLGDSPKEVLKNSLREAQESSVEKDQGFAEGNDGRGENVVELAEVETVAEERSEGEKSDEDEKLEEWEGIERTELEEQFWKATAYVGSHGGEYVLSSLSGEEQMQLYGLHRVAMEGPCYEPQPMALNVSARARWHAWQRLGSMNPDVAMEQYINLLSEKIPGWMQETPEVGGVHQHEEAATSGAMLSDLPLDAHHLTETERKLEGHSCSHDDIEAAAGNTGQGVSGTG